MQRYGLNIKEIADELNIARETAIWLLNREYEIVEITSLIGTIEERLNHVKEDQRKEVIELSKETESPFEYDIAVSYARENREIVEQIAKKLRENDIRVFYDVFEKSNLWGKKLSTHFKKTYGEKSCFVLVFVSKEYSLKDWTNFEFDIARDEANVRKTEFILPVRLDNTPLLGLHKDIAYLDLNTEGIEGIVSSVIDKLNNLNRP